jgi:hypothetical protein
MRRSRPHLQQKSNRGGKDDPDLAGSIGTLNPRQPQRFGGSATLREFGDDGPFSLQRSDRADDACQHAREWGEVARRPLSQCRHQVIVNADHWPGDLTVKSFGPRMVCTRWGIIGAGAAVLGKSGPERGAPARFPSMLFIPVGGPPSPFKVVVSPAGGTK